MALRKIEMVGVGFDPLTVRDYFLQVVKPKMLWHPVGVVLHNTEAPNLKNWPGFTPPPERKPITVAQRLRNLNHFYANVMGWPSGPHCFVAPDKIWIFYPPWKRGTGSPSWNRSHFQVELVGDFAKELMPKGTKDGGVAICAAMYEVMGIKPSLLNFKFHKDDPKTSHKRCPGVNVGSKDQWIKDILLRMKKP